MLNKREDVVKQMIFYVGATIDTIFNHVESSVNIATTALNIYTDQHYINLSYNIINKTGRKI